MNFAVNTTEETVARGNKLLEELTEPGEKSPPPWNVFLPSPKRNWPMTLLNAPA